MKFEEFISEGAHDVIRPGDSGYIEQEQYAIGKMKSILIDLIKKYKLPKTTDYLAELWDELGYWVEFDGKKYIVTDDSGDERTFKKEKDVLKDFEENAEMYIENM